MRYLGGKSRLAKHIAQIISPRGLWWDPFCGGLSIAVQLSKYGKGIVSDSCEPLISLYRAVARGWIPPDTLSKQEWDSAKELEDSNPFKAFAGFGCSYGGMWFTGYEGRYTVVSRTHPNGMIQDKPRAAKISLLRDIEQIKRSGSSIVDLDFLNIRPGSLPIDTIYCDPPYAGTASYGAVNKFNHEKFWDYCALWSRRAEVFVSELSCPLRHELVWSREYEKRVGAQGQQNSTKIEKLFYITE